jgi:DNA-binding GntR family transcriptional regulator
MVRAMPTDSSIAPLTASRTPLTLRAHAEAVLRETLVSGVLVPGERINEVEFAAALGMSRGIVREALRSLEQEGLLTAVPRRGVFVRELTADEARDISAVRLALEVTAARQIAAGPPHAETLATLEARYAELERLVDSDFATRLRADLAFHESICACSGNATLLSTWRSLMAAVTVMLLNVGPVDTRPLLDPERHRPLLEVIEAGDEAAIEPVWREHFGYGVDHIVSHLRAREPESP